MVEVPRRCREVRDDVSMSNGWIVLAAAVGAAPALFTFWVGHRFERRRYEDDLVRTERERAQSERDRAAEAARREREVRLTAYKSLIDALWQLQRYQVGLPEVVRQRQAVQPHMTQVLIYGSPAARQLVLDANWTPELQSVESFAHDAIMETEIELREKLTELLAWETSPDCSPSLAQHA
jgi:hypothetical protein